MDKIPDIIDKQFYTAGEGHIYGGMIDHIEKIVITKALERSGGNQLEAARFLGLHRNTLRNKIRKLNIDVGRFKK